MKTLAKSRSRVNHSLPNGTLGYPHLDGYKEKRVLTFHSRKDLKAAIALLWTEISLDEKLLSAKIKELKRIIRKWYRHFGSPQDEVWVVAQQIIRQD